jgi:hypothetical protein
MSQKIALRLGAMLTVVAVFTLVAHAQTVRTEIIGPLNGGLTITLPIDPCRGTDSITFVGNVHVNAAVDLTARTVDYHINLLSVKGTGTLAKYVGNGSVSLLNQTFVPPDPIVPPDPVRLRFAANLIPEGVCRQSFNGTGALPVNVDVTFNTDGTLNTASSTVNTCSLDTCPTP